MPEHLDWLADLKGMQRRTPPGPYHLHRYQWLTRPGAVPRLLEAPTPLLRKTLRRLLHELRGDQLVVLDERDQN